MEIAACLILRRLSILAILLLLFTAVLSAQVKIKERISIGQKTLNSQDEPITSFTLQYPAIVDVGNYLRIYGYGIPYTMTCNSDTVHFFGFACVEWKSFGKYPAGTVLTFNEQINGENHPLEIVYCIQTADGDYCPGVDNLCGGSFFLTGGGPGAYTVDIGRSEPLPPFSISFDIDWSYVSLMYLDSAFIPIHSRDACGGLASLPTPVIYRVEITTGQEWSSLYDEVSGKKGTAIDSLYSPDGMSGFYLKTTDNEPSEPQQGSLTVSSYGDVVPPITLTYSINPYYKNLLVTPGRKEIFYGDTTKLSLSFLDVNGNPMEAELLDAVYTIKKGSAYSDLQSLDSTIVGDEIEGLFPSAILKTIDTADAPDSLTILIVARAFRPCPECQAGKIIPVDSSKKRPGTIIGLQKRTQSQKLKQSDLALLPDFKSAMQLRNQKTLLSHTVNSLKSTSIAPSLSLNVKSNSPRLSTYEYDGYTTYHVGLTRVLVRKRMCIHASFAKTPLSVGDTTKLTFTYSGTDIPVPESCLLDILILNTDSIKGSLLSATNTSGEFLNNAAQPIKYIAPSTIPGNSMAINIKTVESEASGASASIKGKSPDPTNISVIKTKKQIDNSLVKSIQGVNGKPAISQSLSPAMLKSLEGPVCEFKAGDIKEYEILLGETKYYYAIIDDKGNLQIMDDGDPDHPSKNIISDVKWTVENDPKSDAGDTLRVYYEKINPTFNSNPKWTYTYNKMMPLNGMLRIIGRYWRPNKTFRAILKATSGTKENKIIVEIKKPTSLGTTLNTAVDVLGGPDINIDELIILYAGDAGIPPQLIKSQMGHEAKIIGNKLYPSYRYEPWEDWRIQKSPVRSASYRQHPFFINDDTYNTMGTGRSIPTDHHNVEPFTYPTVAKRIGEYLLQDDAHWEEYTKIKNGSLEFIEGREFTKYASTVKELWVKGYLKKTDQTEILNLTQQYMKDFINSYLNQWWAQTRLEASYGYLQLIYMTAVAPQWKIYYNKNMDITKGTPPNDFDKPEDLNNHNILLPLYIKFTINNIKSTLDGNTGGWAYNWTDGFEGSWKRALKIYNNNETYGIEVIGWSRTFSPISAEEK